MAHLDCCRCRECGGSMKVYDSRTRIMGPSRTVHRYKKCLNCGAKYQTAEVPFSVAREVWEEEC